MTVSSSDKNPGYRQGFLPSEAARALLQVFLMLAPVAASAIAQDMPDVRQNAIVTGDSLPRSVPSSARGGILAETIYLKGDRQRMDFDAGPTMRGRLLGDGKHMWLQKPPSTFLLPADHVPIVKVTHLDPRQPCWKMDISCHGVEGRTIAGRQTTGWRYSHAGQAGPMGTDSGVFWLDAETGLLLAFHGGDLAEHSYRMETIALHFEPLDDSLFVLPDTKAVSHGAAPSSN